MTDSSELSPVLRSAREPVGSGSSPLVAVVLALGLIALGVVGVQEAAVRSGLWSSRSWTSATLDALDGRAAPQWLVAPAGVLLVLAFVLLAAALRRRPRTTVALTSETGAFVRTSDLAVIVQSAIEGLDGVTETDVRATRTSLKVRAVAIVPRSANPSISSDVEERVAPVLAALDRPPRVRVSIKNKEFA